MARNTTITAAIRRFDDWSQPWLFRSAVIASLDSIDAALFEEIWVEATATTHWSESDLSACARRAASALRERFPFLESEADVVSRAAAYQWR